MWQYVKLGNIADLYNCNLASLGIIFLRRTRTPTFLLAILHISLIWVLKLSSSSNVTPSNFKSGDDLITCSSILTLLKYILLKYTKNLAKNQVRAIISYARYSEQRFTQIYKALYWETTRCPFEKHKISPPEPTDRNICCWVFLQMRELIAWGTHED